MPKAVQFIAEKNMFLEFGRLPGAEVNEMKGGISKACRKLIGFNFLHTMFYVDNIKKRN